MTKLEHTPPRTGRNRARRLLVVCCLLPLAGCVVETRPVNGDDDVRDHVEAIGFPRESAEVAGNVVRVDGDMLLDRAALLAGEYEEPAPEGTDVDKGYRYSTIVSSANRGNIKLVFSTTHAPSTRIRDAFNSAANAWSNVPDSAIRIGTTKTGPSITVHMLSALDWPGVSGCPADKAACAEIPVSGRPGANVWIMNRDTGSNCRDWSATSLSNVTRHELGHAIGFAHPKEAGSSHVADTGTCADAAAACEFSPGYSTVMSSARAATRCEVTPSVLTMDDYKTCWTVY